MAYQGQGVHSALNYTINREIGRRHAAGTRDWCHSTLYSAFETSSVTETTPHQGQDWGAVFGFGFSPDGKILTAACEHRCMLLYDPLNAKLITRRFKTHDDCVNCVRFLDNRIFATCSDDNTVRLWDSRYLTNELKILRGHSSWVKNIEYSSSCGTLVTSGFDGNIFAWDINNFSEDDFADPVFYINGALRTKLTNDESKLIVSTLGGYFLIIHNLDLDYLKEDLAGFKPHLYRLMQLMNTPLHHALQYNYMFTRRRNRVEFMCDFPDSDNAESIATMQVHPQDWCVVSRNTTLDEETEWTCVHDIQSQPQNDKFELQLFDNRRNSESSDPTCSRPKSKRKRRTRSHSHSERRRKNLDVFSPLWILQETSASENFESNEDDHESGSSSDEIDEIEEEEEVSDEETEATPRSPTDTRPALSPEDRPSLSSLTQPSLDSSSFTTSSSNSQNPASSSTSTTTTASEEGGGDLPIMPVSLCPRWRKRRMAIVHNSSTSQHQQQGGGGTRSVRTEQLRIRDVKPRLLYYTEEPNVGRGFIKEQSFSSDGRVIASPYGHHVRLLAFDKQCRELCDDVPASPRPLVEVSNCALLKSNILTSTFSPVHCLLAAGGVDGSITFCHPVL